MRAAAGVHGARREECWEDACDGFEEPRVASSSEEGEKKKEEDEDEDDEDDEERRMDMRGVWDGESVGPDAKDVYIDRCRSGRVSLVPILEPVAILNFANALF